MHHVTNVNADLQFDPPIGGHVAIAFGQGALDLDGALGRFQRAVELDQEGVADGFDFGAVEARKDFAQQPRCSSNNSWASFSSRWLSAL